MMEQLVVARPTRWNAAQVRRVARVLNGGTPSSDPENWDGDIPFVTPPDLRGRAGDIVATTGRKLTAVGATSGSTVADAGVVVSNRAPIGYVGRLDAPSAFNQGCKVLRPDAQLQERYLAYYMVAAAPVLQELGQGTTFMELSSQSLGSLYVPLPPLAEQRAIADYLDRETAKIDALIEKQTKLISRLRERRSQLRAHLVMARSHPDRDTTDYWFGSIPNHWDSPRLSHKASVVLGRMINAATADDDDVQLPYVAAGSIQPDKLVLDDSKTLSVPIREISKYELRAGDVVVVEGGAGYGRSHVLAEELPGWAFQNHVARVRARNDDIDTRYVREVLEMCRLSGFFEANNRTATLPSLSRDVLGALRIPCPPVTEQQEIADHLDRETAKIDALIAKAERFIELARERRSALITAAVTGQIDVTEGAA